jgi:predicted nucleic acid-binding protein
VAYLADTSAWHRGLRTPDRWNDLVEDDEIVLCTPVVLELLWSAKSRAEYRNRASDLWLGFRSLSLDSRAERTALRTQAALAERSQHRRPSPVDLLIAAVAEVHGAVLLHYDRHFDLIARITGQPTEWLAPRGSLD